MLPPLMRVLLRRRLLMQLLSALLLTAVGAAQSAEQRTARYLDSVRKQPPLLLAFARELPKGGDLHNHLDGAIYAEDLVDFAASGGLCVDRTSSRLLAPPCDSCENYTAKPAARCSYGDHVLYNQMIDAWSMRNWKPGDESGHDHFFAAFDKFGLASHTHVAEAIAASTNRAGMDHLQYVEFMHTADAGASGPTGREGRLESGLRQNARRAAERRLERRGHGDQQETGRRRRPRQRDSQMRNRGRRSRMRRYGALSLSGAARLAASGRVRTDSAGLRTGVLRPPICRAEPGDARRLVPRPAQGWRPAQPPGWRDLCRRSGGFRGLRRPVRGPNIFAAAGPAVRLLRELHRQAGGALQLRRSRALQPDD